MIYSATLSNYCSLRKYSAAFLPRGQLFVVFLFTQVINENVFNIDFEMSCRSHY